MVTPREGAVHGSMLCFMMVLMLFPTFSSAKTSTNFANGFGIPLYESMGGCSEGLNTILMYGIKSDGDLPFGCVTLSGENCSWMDFSATAIGLIIAPFLTVFLCCGFCCARCFEFCKCCCKPCGSEACGGKLPTKDVYPAWEQGLTWGCLAISWIAVFSFSIVGYASFVDFKLNWTDLVDGGVGLYNGPALVKGDINGAITGIKADATRFIDDDVNPLFANLDGVRTNLAALEAQLQALQAQVRELQQYIEGCDTTAPGWVDGTCTVSATNTFHTACLTTETEHYTSGEGVIMSDGAVAPNCYDDITGTPGPCPCCSDCAQVLLDVQEVIDSLPTQARIDELDQPLNTSQIDEDVDEALGDWEAQIDSFEKGNEPLKWLSDNQEDVKGYLGPGRVEGIGILFFLLSWLICALILVAVGLQFAEVGGEMPGYLLWTAFVLGVIHFVIIISPAWGIFSLVAIPYGGFCDEPPSSNVNKDVERFLSDCLIDGDKYIWPLVDPPIEQATIRDNLQAFNARDQIDSEAIKEVLTDVDQYTGAYNIDDINGLDSDENQAQFKTTSTCADFGAAAGPDCTDYETKMAQYRTDVNTRVSAIKTAGLAVDNLVQETKTVAALYEVDIENVFTKTDALLETMTDTAWDIGKCTRFNSLYVGIADPFDGILDSFIATWAALFMIAIFMPIMLCSMGHGAKILYRARHPERERKPSDFEDNGFEHGEGHGHGAGAGADGAFTSVAPPMLNKGGGVEAPGDIVYPSGAPTVSQTVNPGGMPSAMTPQTTYAEERPFSEDTVSVPTAPVFFDTAPQGGQEADLYGPRMYEAQSAAGDAQHIYPYVDQGMA